MNTANVIHACPISTRAFGYNAKNRTFSQERSTLTALGWTTGCVCQDSCDEGFTLVSGLSGREIPVWHSHTETRDGEVLWDEYTPVKPADRRTFDKVIVFND